jgi:hypothetical protein
MFCIGYQDTLSSSAIINIEVFMKIRCQIGIDVEVQTDSLKKFCLDGLDLHHALLEGVIIRVLHSRKQITTH